MLLSESTSSGFFYLAPWLVFAPLTGLLINLIFSKWFKFSEKWFKIRAQPNLDVH